MKVTIVLVALICNLSSYCSFSGAASRRVGGEGILNRKNMEYLKAMMQPVDPSTLNISKRVKPGSEEPVSGGQIDPEIFKQVVAKMSARLEETKLPDQIDDDHNRHTTPDEYDEKDSHDRFLRRQAKTASQNQRTKLYIGLGILAGIAVLFLLVMLFVFGNFNLFRRRKPPQHSNPNEAEPSTTLPNLQNGTDSEPSAFTPVEKLLDSLT